MSDDGSGLEQLLHLLRIRFAPGLGQQISGHRGEVFALERHPLRRADLGDVDPAV
jgi:hypothetical protein